jgi:hypothetical protein
MTIASKPEHITFPCWAVDINDSDIAELLEKELDKEWCQDNLKSWIYFSGTKIYCGMKKEAKYIGSIVDRYILKKKLDFESSVETLNYAKAEENPYFKVF